MLLLKIKNLDNAALRNEDGTLDRDALANIVHGAAYCIAQGDDDKKLYDMNGNPVGSYTLNFRRVSK